MMKSEDSKNKEHELEFDLENVEVPEVDIEYQEDDGNSNCDGGGCTI